MSNFNQITPEQLMRRLGDGTTPCIFDVRIAEDREAIAVCVPTARHFAYSDIDGIAAAAQGREWPGAHPV